jgi:hypothetical protein
MTSLLAAEWLFSGDFLLDIYQDVLLSVRSDEGLEAQYLHTDFGNGELVGK